MFGKLSEFETRSSVVEGHNHDRKLFWNFYLAIDESWSS